MQAAPEDEELTILMQPDGMRFGDVTFGWEAGDALLYLNPTNAPALHPEDAQRTGAAQNAENSPRQGNLFDNRPG